MISVNSITAPSTVARLSLAKAQAEMAQSFRRLSAGLRVNSASDDAAGLAVSISMEAKLKSRRQVMRNVEDGQALTQIAEGALAQIGQNLIRVRELTVQAANGILTSENRQSLQAENDQLVAEIGRIASDTEFNGISLLSGTTTNLELQTGTEAGQTISIALSSASPDNLGLKGDFSLAGGISDAATLVTGAAAFNGAANGLIINGVPIAIQDDGISGAFGFGSAVSIANGINASGISGLSATANPTTFNLGLANVTAPVAPGMQFRPVDLTINGVAIGGVNWDPASGQSFGAALADQINASGTGVSASYGGGLVLTGADGRSISVETNGTNANQTSLTGINMNDGVAKGRVAIGTIDINTTTPIRINHGFSAAAGQGLTIATGTFPFALSSADTLADEQTARQFLQVVDVSIGQVLQMRQALGATQNVLGETLLMEQDAIVNLTEARSRITDADVATEMALLTKNQILQQAGLSVLSQAGQNARAVLSLLLAA